MQRPNKVWCLGVCARATCPCSSSQRQDIKWQETHMLEKCVKVKALKTAGGCSVLPASVRLKVAERCLQGFYGRAKPQLCSLLHPRAPLHPLSLCLQQKKASSRMDSGPWMLGTAGGVLGDPNQGALSVRAFTGLCTHWHRWADTRRGIWFFLQEMDIVYSGRIWLPNLKAPGVGGGPID